MKNLIFIVIFLCWSSSNLFSQYTLDWMNPSGMYNKTAVISVKDNLDNLIVTGYLQSENIYTRKYDIEGDFLWETIDSSGIHSNYQKPVWISCDIHNNILVVGKRYSVSFPWEYPDAVVALKYNSEGILLWKQIVPVSVLIGYSHPGFNLRSEVDNYGNLYIGTAAASPSGFVLIKIHPDGTILYTKNNVTNAPTGFGSMRLKGDKVVLTGSGGNVTAAPVVVYDTSGSLLWTALGTGQSGNDVEIDEEGNVYLLTSYPNQVSLNSGQDVVLYKFNPSGTQLWKKDYDFGGSDFPTRFTLVSNKLSTIGYGTSDATGSPYFDWKTFQADTDGELLWNAHYDGTLFNDEYPNFIVSRPDGKVIVTGIGGPSPDPFNLSYRQMIIIEYGISGEQLWMDTPNIYGGEGLSCMFASDHSLFVISSNDMTAYHYVSGLVSLKENLFENADIIKIFPNPLSAKGILELEESEEKIISVLIYDQMGKIVRTIQAVHLHSGKNQIPVDLSGLENGIYSCRIMGDNTNRTVKFVKAQNVMHP